MRTKQDFLIFAVALLSGAASFLFYRDLIGLNEWYNWFFVIGFSGITIAAMDYFLECYVKTGNALYFLPIAYCVATSAFGTVGNFQVSIEKAIRKSAQYQRTESNLNALQRQQEAYQRQIDKYGLSNPRNQERIADKLQQSIELQDKYEQKLASVKGAVGVTAFHRIAERYRVNSESMLFYFLLSLGILLDGFYLHLRKEGLQARFTKKGDKNARQPAKTVNVYKKSFKKKVDMNLPVNQEIKRLLTETNKSYREIAADALVNRSANWVMKVNKACGARP